MIILPANTLSTGGYEVANSLRFDDGSSPSLTRTASGTNSSTQKWTFSFWIKRFSDGGSAHQRIFLHENNATHTQKFLISFKTDYKLHIETYDGTYEYNVKTDMFFKDIAAWYHIVVRVDTTQGTEADRYRIYVNGTQVALTEVGHGYPTQNWNLSLDDKNHNIGLYHGGSGGTEYLDAALAEFVYCDGQSLAPTSFGEFDEDSPTIWKPIDVSGLTFGNIGYYLDFEDSSAFGNDVSGNNNDFGTVTNLAATDSSTDTPTNNFCTMNPLDNYYGAGTFSEGNLKIVTLSSDYTYYTGTIGLTAGLWYFEAKLTATADDNQVHVGIAGRVTTNAQHELGHYNDTYAYYSADGDSRTNDGDTSYGTGFDTGDVLGVYIDLNANKLYFAKNGTVQNSGTGISITDPASVTAGAYFPAVGDWANQSCTWEVNFGNPSWSLSSAVADKNGYGSFEYNPSSGTFDSASKDFLAICTKNLGSDGG
jgi:hypothetical protein